MRFIHHIDGLPDFTALKFDKYNQYESVTKPLFAYLKDHGVKFEYDTQVQNILIDTKNGEEHTKKIILKQGGGDRTINLTDDGLVFVTNGSIMRGSDYGSHRQAAQPTRALDGSRKLWENLAKQSPSFGRSGIFCKNIPNRSWFISATATVKNPQIEPYIERLIKRNLHDGKVNTGGVIIVTSSNWMISWTIRRQPHFKSQKPNETIVWIYGLHSDTEGNYIKRRIVGCTGEEITKEWLYRLGIPEVLIDDLAREGSADTVPVHMSFVTNCFMSRVKGDRSNVVPEGSANLVFIGNSAESPTRDTIFTTEYSVRTAMEAVYSLLNVDRGVPKISNSAHDIHELIRAVYYTNDKKPLEEVDLPIPKIVEKPLLKKVKKNWIGELVEGQHLL